MVAPRVADSDPKQTRQRADYYIDWDEVTFLRILYIAVSTLTTTKPFSAYSSPSQYNLPSGPAQQWLNFFFFFFFFFFVVNFMLTQAFLEISISSFCR